MEQEKYMLRQQTKRRYILAMARRGAKGILTDSKCRTKYLVLIVFYTFILLCLHPTSQPGTLTAILQPVTDFFFGLAWLLGCLVAIPVCAYIWHSWSHYDDFTRAGVVNFAGEAPLLIERKVDGKGIITLTFQAKGLPLEKWEESRPLIETALNVCVLSLKQGLDNQTFVLHTVPAANALQDVVMWQDTFIPEVPSQISLGVNAAGVDIRMDFTKVPHWLIGAATGCGKTQLLLLILHQLAGHNMILYLADYKGVDFPEQYHKEGYYADNNTALLSMLKQIVDELYNRRTALSSLGYSNIDVYNSKASAPLRRIVLALDETSIILDTTGKSKEEKAEISQITNYLLIIGRLGRAMGIHLIVCTQRPDVASVPGSLKAQLDGRICGHTADAQSSIVILDDGAGAKLPAIPGRFLVRDGMGDDKIIQSYLLPDSGKSPYAF